MDQKHTDQVPYAYFIDSVKGIGRKHASILLEEYGTPENAWRASEKELLQLLGEKRTAAWKMRKKDWDIQEEYEKLLKRGIRFLYSQDPAYPQRLKNIPDPPFALYVRGGVPEDNRPSAAVIGARRCSPYGRGVAEELGRELAAAGIQVVSGLALGVDGISQRAAAQQGGPTFGVLGCGVDICYPPSHQTLYQALLRCGGVLSEYLPGTQPRPELFPPRNRIISGLADAVVVVEARRQSGTLITVDMALEQGREIYCVPGRVTDRLSDGCNRLISQGAGVVLSVEDLLEKLSAGWNRAAAGTPAENESGENKPGENEAIRNAPSQKDAAGGLGRRERALWELLDYTPAPVQQLYIQMSAMPGMGQLTLQEMMELLLELTLKGKVENVSGSYYAKKM
ncbi:MAG: DNA-protecting protein DprA [Lachnospiraceae bacterium]|nr:DNA-protecting protein DprA [Lachnospiraceae bacterium]